jgi:hypothetical protein
MATKPFRLTDDQIAICHEQERLGWLDAALETFHQQHDYDQRPIIGAANSLNTTGDRAWLAAWNASRDENMSEAHAEWERVCAGERALEWREAA